VLQVPISLDLETLSGLKLGELSALGLVVQEGEAMGEGRPLLQDLHAYSNLRAEDRAQLFELWWSRSWGPLSARLGKLDANDHFAVSEHEAHLINGAAGYSPSIFGMPSYPDAAWSAQLAYQSERVDVSVGVFDGGSTSLSATPTGARLGLSPEALKGELFWVAQLTAHLGALHTQSNTEEQSALVAPQQDRGFEARAPLHLTFGVWMHRGEVVPVSEGRGEPSEGMYVTADLELMRLARGGELGLGGQLAVSPAYHPLHVSVALTATELLRPIGWAQRGPSLAFGLSHLSIADELTHSYQIGASHEQLIELTATLPLTPSLLVSLSALSFFGDQLFGGAPSMPQQAHLLVGRLTLGAL
jgi:hypothetical protein